MCTCLPLPQSSQPDLFNSFLRELKSDFLGTRYAAFWTKVVGEGVTLVSSEECGVSDVSPEQAKQVSMPHLPVQQLTTSFVVHFIKGKSGQNDTL